jgi:SH3 domain protein
MKSPLCSAADFCYHAERRPHHHAFIRHEGEKPLSGKHRRENEQMLDLKKQTGTWHDLVAILPLILLPMMLLLPPSVSDARAETWYVQPSAEVPIRSGQGTEYKILSVVPDGMSVAILEEADPWVKVRTPGGAEGWMLKRYLSKDPPLSDRVSTLQARNEKLEKENETIRRELEELSAAHSRSQQELNACITERDEIRSNYQSLRADTADVITIKQNLTDKVQENQLIRQQLAELERENTNLQRNTSLKWFLAGGLVLLVGWVLGLISTRSRRRKSSLY